MAIGSRWVLNADKFVQEIHDVSRSEEIVIYRMGKFIAQVMARVNDLNYEFQGHGERLEQLSFWKKLPIGLQTENGPEEVCDGISSSETYE